MQTGLHKFGSDQNGLGDVLLLTSLCKYAIGKYTIQLPPSVSRFAMFFDGLAQVEITEQIQCIQNIGNEGHFATRKLRNFHLDADLLDNRPVTFYTDPESEQWAASVIAGIPRPVIYVPNCSKKWAHLRNMPAPLAEGVLKTIRDGGNTPIIVSSSQNDTPLQSEVKLMDLDLRKYICLLRRVGIYVGCNTGDMHMAIAVGAITNVFQPRSSAWFGEADWNYRHPTIHYSNF